MVDAKNLTRPRQGVTNPYKVPASAEAVNDGRQMAPEHRNVRRFG